MKCYIHIGSPKTATSSIQSFLSLNKKLLYDYDYYVDFFGYAHNLTTAFYCKEKYDSKEFFSYLEIYSQDDLDRFKEHCFEVFQKAYDQNKSKKVLISSEFLQGLSGNIKELRNLKVLLNDLGFDEYKFIYYIREQGDSMNSTISQAAKLGRSYVKEADILQKAQSYNYMDVIKGFESVFGRENLDLRIFEKERFKNGSIIEDFLDAVDFEGNALELYKPKNKNESLSYSGIQILNEYNKIKTSKDTIDENRVIFTRIISKNFTTPKYQLPKEIYEKIQKQCELSNEWVREHYFPKQKTLFKLQKYDPSPQPKIEEGILKNVVESFIELSKISIFNLLSFINSLDEDKTYVIYGYTQLAKIMLRYLSNRKIFIVDGVKFNAQDIKHPDQLLELKYEKIIVSVIGLEEEIISDLISKYKLRRDQFLTLENI